MLLNRKPAVAWLALALCAVGMLAAAGAHTDSPVRHRLIVLTDIEADPDDTQSLIRLVLYANEIDIEGLIATTSVHQKADVFPESIHRIIAAYRKVQQNLATHAPGYPAAESLAAVIKQGLPVYGMAGVGDGKDSPGSDWIVKCAERNDDRPLWISVWGGANTLAQALHKIRRTRSKADADHLIDKLRVYTISDQDDSGIWIRRNFPQLFFIVSPGGYGNGTWTAITGSVPGANNEVTSNRWLAENIQQGHGPLGALYPDVAYGMEGDTPAWLALIPNGLSVPEHPEWGGWGGRYEFYRPDLANLDPKGFTGGVPVEEEPRAIWTNAMDEFTPAIANQHGVAIGAGAAAVKDSKVTLWRWREDFQNDFAARIDWTTASYRDANHPPIPATSHPDRLTVRSGEYFVLDASGTTDPDGDSLSYSWFQYPEAGSYRKPIKLSGAANLYRRSANAPEVAKTETLQFILRVTDKGKPRLSRYRRVIVTIEPKR